MASADVLLHPVRLRIVQALLGDRVLTATDLRAELPEVAPATLYRHLAVLTDAQVLSVVAQRRVRGAVERSYALVRGAAEVPPDELSQMTPDQHRAGFQAFVAGLLATFDAYAAGGDIDFVRDIVGYRQVVLHLSRDEALRMVTELNRVVRPLLALGPAPGRKRLAFSSVLIPVAGPAGTAGAAGRPVPDGVREDARPLAVADGDTAHGSPNAGIAPSPEPSRGPSPDP